MVYKMYRIVFSVIPSKKLGIREFTEAEILFTRQKGVICLVRQNCM